MLASVGYYGFWGYYRYTGDAETMRVVYPAVRDYLSIWELDERGLVRHRTGEWDWTDWGKNMDVAVLESAWYYLALRGAVGMADLLDEPADAARYRGQMGRIESGFNKHFWQGTFYRSPAHKLLTDDRANALAVVAGLADPSYYPAITEFLKTNMHASPYMEKYVLEALYLMRQPEAAMERMLTRYGSMIDASETTLWENFARPGSKEPGSGTYNHAWSGGPLTMMHQYIAGIEPLEPGFKRFSVRPQLGALKEAAVTVPTRFGDIVFSARRETEREVKIELTVPPGTTAEVTDGAEIRTCESGAHTLVINTGLWSWKAQ
jgi:glycogen debranching enzyme